MRIVFTSDLHVDHHPEVAALVRDCARALEPDVLVVAGDVSSEPAHLEAALATLRPAAPRALFIPGNHDLWCRAGEPTSSRQRDEELVPARARAAGFDPLGRAPVEIGGVTFAGVTGWYDYSLRNRELDATFSLDDYRRGAWGKLRWNDKQRIRWPGDDGVELDDPAICDGQVRDLERQLAGLTAPVVVVTHHLPFVELRTSSGEPPWDFLNGFMGSERLGAAILAAPQVRLALCGHTHFRKSATVERPGAPPLRAEASPVGYPREYTRAGLDLAARVRDRVTLATV